jgi:PAS domain S-box-containing protein
VPHDVRPTGVERSLSIDDVIVTKTDLKGRITYANEVFCAISAMSEHDLLGQPHSVIRHPDMPRAVFHLLWETIGRGEEVFAYVLNLAADGAHYWVLAHVTPSRDAAGRVIAYHSNRRTPSAAALARIKPLYQRLLAEEARHQRASSAAQAGADLLAQILAERGVSYDQFVWDLTNGAAA